MAWDYSKLPDSKLEHVRRLVEQEDTKGLLIVHNNYKLSSYTYCCDTRGVLLHFKKLLDEREGKDN